MPVETTERGSPGWWLARLHKKMIARDADLRNLEKYYQGDHPLAFASDKFLQAFGGLFNEFADNWCGLVVDVVRERLNVSGFRFGAERQGDDAAWGIWQRNQLDSWSDTAHSEALKLSEASVIVWPDAEGRAEITVEHPREVYVEFEAGSRIRRAAALKVWQDDGGHLFATLYLPDGLYKYRSVTKQEGDFLVSDAVQWDERRVADEDWPLPNPLRVVPVVPLLNKPGLITRAESELRSVIPLQDAVNKLVADMLVASEYAAFRQRWVTGLEIDRDPETNALIHPFPRASVERMFVAEGEGANFGEFEASDLENYVKAIEMLVQSIASQTRVPPHYFFLRGEFPSGESIQSAEAGLVAKAKARMRFFGETWEEVMRLAFAVEDDARADATDAETLWANPEIRSEAQLADALLKQMAFGVPTEALWEKAGYSPQQIARFKMMRQEDALSVATAFEMPVPVGNGQV